MAENKRIEFLQFIHCKVPKYVYVDKNRIQQILRNYLTNAIKFTKFGAISVYMKY